MPPCKKSLSLSRIHVSHGTAPEVTRTSGEIGLGCTDASKSPVGKTASGVGRSGTGRVAIAATPWPIKREIEITRAFPAHRALRADAAKKGQMRRFEMVMNGDRVRTNCHKAGKERGNTPLSTRKESRKKNNCRRDCWIFHYCLYKVDINGLPSSLQAWLALSRPELPRR